MNDACARGVHQHWETHRDTGKVRCGLCGTVFARQCPSPHRGRAWHGRGPQRATGGGIDGTCSMCGGSGLILVRNLDRLDA